jgi:hypothetical protein
MHFSLTLKVLMLCAICASVTGCASDSGVVTESQGNYFIAKQGATGFNAVAPIRAQAVEEARRFCLGQPGPGNDMFCHAHHGDTARPIWAVSQSRSPFSLWWSKQHSRSGAC